MKRFLLFGLLIGIVALFTAKAQNNVGIGTTSPVASAILDLTATDKGFLMPRVTLVAAANGTSPVNAPATGLLVYNTGGALTAGFYYWNGSMWVQVGASGASCVTLDEAYDCGGNGTGRVITADAGGVEINVGVGSTSTEGIYVTTSNGSSGTPTLGVGATHTGQYGAAFYGENTAGNNMFSAVQGVHLGTNTSTTSFPTAVSGYFDGTGIGVGVWGENTSNSAVGAGAGIYGNGLGTKTYGGWFYSQYYPGIDAETGSASSTGAQIVSSGASYTNPGMLVRGTTQIDCSPNTQHSIIFNNLAAEPTLAPSAGQWGYLGTNSVAWYYMYYYNAIAVSKREYKRDIQPLDNNLYAFVMDDIMKMKPSLYKFNNENDTYIEGNESKTRYNFHLGLILDEAPDYIQDNAFSGIDIYALSTLTLAGVQYLNNEIETIKSQVAISDFGTGSITQTEIRIEYSSSFASAEMENIPVVMITPTSPGSKYYIKSQDKTGFVLVSENGAMTFNWTAMGQKVIKTPAYNVSPLTMSQLRIDNTKKQQMRSFSSSLQQEPLILQRSGNPADFSSSRANSNTLEINQ
ncbi:MAG: hypothetical protein CVU11_11590 [Bacteroidetes bacterium HGW-Bacteroidetes-6]|nr:MAG: hypothetical protein CVU11_11590 [Bacteroidetes bacterium HGW-Bacteroidetes-6]